MIKNELCKGDSSSEHVPCCGRGRLTSRAESWKHAPERHVGEVGERKDSVKVVWIRERQVEQNVYIGIRSRLYQTVAAVMVMRNKKVSVSECMDRTAKSVPATIMKWSSMTTMN